MAMTASADRQSFARSHSITSSARASSEVGISRPRALWRSALHLPLQLVEKAQVGALRNDLVGRRLDHARFAQAQRIEPDRIFGVVLAPLLVRDFFQRLERIIVARGKPRVDDPLCDPLGLRG